MGVIKPVVKLKIDVTGELMSKLDVIKMTVTDVSSL